MTALLQTVGEQRHARDVAEWLKKLRERFRLSQCAAAKIAGVHRNTVSSWERATTTPTAYQIDLLAKFVKQQNMPARGKGGAR